MRLREYSLPGKLSALGIAALIAFALTGCGSHENQWQTLTGSPQELRAETPAPPIATENANSQRGNSNETRIHGCLSGADHLFTLVDDQTATTYRLRGDPDGLRVHDGQVVEVIGGRHNGGEQQGAPEFDVAEVNTIAERCPLALNGARNELNRPPTSKVGLREDWPASSQRSNTPKSTHPVPEPPQ